MALLRTAPLKGFKKTVLDLGGNPDDMLKELNLSQLILEDPELIITHESFLRLLNLAAEQTQCDHFGFMLAKQLDISVFGAIGLLLQNSDTVGNALDSFTRYYSTRFQESHTGLKVEGDFAYFYFQIEKTPEEIRQNIFLATGIGMMLMRFLCGKTWKPLEFHTIEKVPENYQELSRFFEAPVRFGQEENLMIFKASDLERRFSEKTAQLKRYIQPQIDQMEKQLPNDIVDNTESLIRILLPDGNCTVDYITSMLSINQRSLQRKLRAKGTSYRQLLEKVRKSIAQNHLLHSDLSQTQLAYLLGYSELSAFTLAFKRWFGVAPSIWKDQNSRPHNL